MSSRPKRLPGTSLPVHDRYLNREYSWLRFNERVLAQAAEPGTPILERIKFLAIFESNLDEFYMVRVSGLIEQQQGGVTDRTPDGLSATEQLQLIAEMVAPMRQRAARLFTRSIKPALGKAGIKFRKFNSLPKNAQKELSLYFRNEVFPVCTPLMLHPTTTFPFISNRSLNIMVELRDGDEIKFARVKVPSVLPRLVRVPGRPLEFILLEELIAHHVTQLFPGTEVAGWSTFRVIRDADIEIRELEAADLIDAVEQSLRLRRFGDPVLLEVDSRMSAESIAILRQGLELDQEDVVKATGLLGYELFWEVASLDLPDHKLKPHTPYGADRFRRAATLFEEVRHRDVLLFHPYDSFVPVESFVAAAASDPDVIGIKMTLYRVGTKSPIVESLLAAAEAGKQVAVMVELKARFDENNNLLWSRALERAGVHVTYGFAEFKTHCKLCLIVRREQDGIRTYAHIGTGNYNPNTARLYTDLGLFTSNVEITQDISELFNFLTGFSKQANYRQMLVAPLNLREAIIERIHREIQVSKRTGKPGLIMFKLNSLVDPEVIDALYEASQAGVKVRLDVRGICCLRPGVRGLSDRIQVNSVIGRFLEHARIYYFQNGGDEEVFIGSADMMRRNLDRRIEALAPVRDPRQIQYLRQEVLERPFHDTANAWVLRADGTYERRERPAREKGFAYQDFLRTHSPLRLLASQDPERR